ncbi:MAG: sulfotransferase domain-containing protein [Thermomicrobiales bacterium]|nr:sulfotransferase domain-containing protein [Thermomicrobiales bacterium]
MRIVISSPPKMGNKWLKCLLSRVYDLQWVIGEDSPNTNVAQFKKFVDEGRFPENTIFHQHVKYKPALCDIIDTIPAHLVTIVRDPYDAFVSMYHWMQTRTEYDRERGRVRPKERPRDAMYDKPIDDPAVLDFLATSYGEQIQRAHDWVTSGRAIVVRYEDLHKDAVETLTRVTDQIEPVDPERVKQAVEACNAENMRNMSQRMSKHVRAAKVGDSRGKLDDAHLKIFREQYGDLVTAIGYEVR